MIKAWLPLAWLSVLLACPVFAQEPEEPGEDRVTTVNGERAGEDAAAAGETGPNPVKPEEEPEISSITKDEAALDEDPESQRRTKVEEQPELQDYWPDVDFYGSIRLHGITNRNDATGRSRLTLGDGASRVGVRAEWEFGKRWWLFGRLESGFDIFDTFAPKGSAGDKNGSGFEERLLYGGVNSEKLTATFGKNWSAYYKIAGMADRFAVFGGQAAGVYNAGTDGGATGTGRADEVLQVKIFTSSLKALRIKPFNLNLQFQDGRPIPHVGGRSYGNSFGVSAWLENEQEFGLGLAYHVAGVEDPDDPAIGEAGIRGDASALATSFRYYGENWYGALVLSRLQNVETTDKLQYFEGYGAELYTQWQFRKRWWLVAGANWLKPDSDNENAGQYEVKYTVFGLRYTLDSFNRMLYVEYKLNDSKLADGSEQKDELIFGFRWDFGH